MTVDAGVAGSAGIGQDGVYDRRKGSEEGCDASAWGKAPSDNCEPARAPTVAIGLDKGSLV